MKNWSKEFFKIFQFPILIKKEKSLDKILQ